MNAGGDNDRAAGSGELGDAATRLAQDTAELARQELRAIQGQALTGLRRFTVGGTLLAGAGLCAVLAVTAAHETVLRAAESLMPRARASALLVCLYAAGTVTLGIAARGSMRAAARAAAEALEHGHEAMPTTPSAPGESTTVS